jgi:hypothetical protein
MARLITLASLFKELFPVWSFTLKTLYTFCFYHFYYLRDWLQISNCCLFLGAEKCLFNFYWHGHMHIICIYKVIIDLISQALLSPLTALVLFILSHESWWLIEVYSRPDPVQCKVKFPIFIRRLFQMLEIYSTVTCILLQEIDEVRRLFMNFILKMACKNYSFISQIKVSKVLKKVSSSKMKSSTAVDLRVSKG